MTKSLWMVLKSLLLVWGLLAVYVISQQIPQTASVSAVWDWHTADVTVLLLQNYTLPRIAMALLAGAVLAWASVLLQQIIRNPLASDSTLAVSSGAQLALMGCAIFAPNMLIYGQTLIGFVGAVGALLLVFILAWRKTLSPLLMILSGLVVNLYCGALAATLLIFYPEESRGLINWGAGSLIQESWHDTAQLSLLVIPAVLLQAVFAKSLAMLSLDEEKAISLGVPVSTLRMVGILLAAYLVAIVVSQVGMLGFIGLIAVTVTRQCGIYSFKTLLWGASSLSALLLGITDLTLQIYAQQTGQSIPTGAVTALLGTPLLLWLMFKLLPHDTRLATQENPLSIRKAPCFTIYMLWGVLLVVLLLALIVGKTAGTPEEGSVWQWSSTLLDLRLPRVLLALASGIMLAIAGVFLQRVSDNPMASPELLGITSGVGLGVLVFILLGLNSWAIWPWGIAGALLVLSVIMLINYRNGMLPEKVLLTGISLTALFDAVQRIWLASGDLRVYQLLSWSAGSTYQATLSLAVALCFIAVLAWGVAVLLSRWLELLMLQASMAQALGLNVQAVRWICIVFCAVLTALAALSIGPLSFVGLCAPHFAKSLGFLKPRSQLGAAVVLGATLMVLADWLGRQSLFPYEIPAGLVATLLGGAYFVIVMRKL